MSDEHQENLGFTFQATKSGDVLIQHHGRQVTILRGKVAAQFLKATSSYSEAELQQQLARLTGNYKRGNERTAQKHPRNQI